MTSHLNWLVANLRPSVKTIRPSVAGEYWQLKVGIHIGDGQLGQVSIDLNKVKVWS